MTLLVIYVLKKCEKFLVKIEMVRVKKSMISFEVVTTDSARSLNSVKEAYYR